MANINLPFEGEVTADNKPALKVTNKGQGNVQGLWGETTQYIGKHRMMTTKSRKSN